MKRFNATKILATIALTTSAAVANAIPTELIVNGGFETGDFTGWSNSGSGSGFGFTINDGPATALAPISGSFDAVSSQTGPGLNTLIQQSFMMSSGITSATLSWSDRIQNFGGVFSDPNQEFRVLLEDMQGNLIQEIFSTSPGDPLIQLGPNFRSFDITSLAQGLAGQQVQLSFEQQDNLNFFNVSLDDVSLLVEAPEPGPLALLAIGLLGVGVSSKRKRAA